MGLINLVSKRYERLQETNLAQLFENLHGQLPSGRQDEGSEAVPPSPFLAIQLLNDLIQEDASHIL